MSTALLAASYVVHVVSAGLWTGTVLYVPSAVLPAARAGHLDTRGLATTLDAALQITRWTGVTLPLTGVYQVWVLYPTDTLLGTTRGHLVLAMAALWGVMNAVVEAAAFRARGDGLGLARHFVTPLDPDALAADASALAATTRPYFLAASALAVLLLANAALLAVGVPV